MNDLERDMLAEVRTLLGSGLVREYYEQIASGFADIAQFYIEVAEREARVAAIREERKRQPRTKYRFIGRNKGALSGGRPSLIWEEDDGGTGNGHMVVVDAEDFWAARS